MSLAAFQNALSRLLTDEKAREAFAGDGEKTGALWQLSREEISALQDLAARDIPQFAQALQSKRCIEVGELLPRTRRALGQEYEALFFSHARGFVPSGTQKVRVDAIAFADWLQTHEPQKSVCELARYEAFLLRAPQAFFRVTHFDLKEGRLWVLCWRGRMFQRNKSAT